MNILKFIVANNILRLRTDAEMSRAELGEKIHYSEEFILQWERAESMPDDDAIEALAAAFGVTPDYLLESHDEWVSKEQKEFMQNSAMLAGVAETKNRTSPHEAEKEPEPIKKPKKKKTKGKISILSLVPGVLLLAFGVIMFGIATGFIGCEATADPDPSNTADHEHEYGEWQLYAGATEHNEGEMRKYCYICEEYISRVLPQSTQGLFFEVIGNGICIVTGVGHGPETPLDAFKTIVIPPYIADMDGDGNPLDLRVVAIGEGFLGSLGDMYLERVQEIIIPDTVTSIGDYAFYGTGITSVILPENLTSIGDYAYAHCESLREIYLPDGVDRIGEGAFSGCKSLGGVRLESQWISEIAPHTFRDCTSLEGVYLGNAAVIGESAFENCTSLRNFDAENLERIEAAAFKGCTSIEMITFPERLSYIGYCAFEGCTGISQVGFYVSASAANEKITIAENAFRGCTGIRSPLYLDRVISIGEYAFADCTMLGEVKVYAEDIGMGAFSGCETLSALELYNGVKYIGDYAFEYCLGLTEVTFPESVEIVGDYAFKQCINLKKIWTTGSILKMGSGSNAFEDCHSLSEIHLYDMVGNMGEVFAGNTNIIDVAVERGEIPANAFKDCTDLLYISLYEGVTSIGDYAFYGVSNSLGFLIPPTLTYIGNYAFAYTNMYEFTIGENVEYVGKFAFYESTIQRVTIESGKTNFEGYTFANCASLYEVNLPDDMTRIPDGMFSGCTSYNFAKIVLPDSVTEIGDYAFDECNQLCEITISKNVNDIGNHAFGYCRNFNKINFGGTKSEWEMVYTGADWNVGVNGNITVVCTDGEITVTPI